MKKNRSKHTSKRTTAALTLAALMAASGPAAAYGADKPNDNLVDVEAPRPDYNQDLSPSFAYSEEKWASLRDNVMEYGELADLIHEYNPTVRSNRSSYNDMRNKDINDVYDELMNDIDDIWDAADAAGSDDDAAATITEATLNFQANSLRQQADNNYQDPEMQKIQYDQAEANLVYQAQQLMATYEQSGYNLSYLQNTKNLLETQYNIVQAQRNVGMATDTDVLNAQKNVQDQEASILSAQKSADNVHRQLCLMLGWQVDSQPEIRSLPEPDLSRIDAMNPAADLEKAVANNYDVRYYNKMYNNVTTEELKESTQASRENAKDTVARSLNSQYNTVLTARDTLNTAQSQLALAQTNLNTAATQLAVGTITQADYQSMENSLQSAQNSVRSAKLQLQLAMDGYDWIVNGLTLSN